MSPCALALLWSLLGTALVPVDQDVCPDDFVGVSCPRADACLLLDRAGNLFFTADGGRSRQLRADLSGLEPVQIRFSGLLTGWVLTRAGRVWHTRDGGRVFSPLLKPGTLPPGELASCLAIGPDGGLWVGARTGRIFRQAAGGRLDLVGEGPSEPVVSLAVDPHGAAAVYGSGTLVALSPASSAAALTSRPLKLRALGVSIGPDGRLAVAGCRGVVRWSTDRGRTWRGPRAAPKDADCLRPMAWPANGPLVLAADRGGLVLADRSHGTLEALTPLGHRRFNDAARVRARVVLVGDGGGIAWLTRRADGSWGATQVASGGPGVIGLQVSGRRGVVRSMADGSLSISQDGGQTWHPATSPGVDVTRAIFTDARNGFALLAGRRIAGTRDGASTWETLANWPDLRLTDLTFFDSNTGWAVGQAGAMVRTTNGGHSWALDRMPAFSGDLIRVQFMNRKRGYAVGSQQAVFRSEDGGTTWHRLRSGPGALRDLAFLDPKRGYVVGDQGTVWFTSDGGESWEPRNVPTDSSLTCVAFCDATRGLAAADGGQLWATLDGGRTWHPLGLHTRAEIRALVCLPATSQCLVGGDGGLLLLGDPFNELTQ